MIGDLGAKSSFRNGEPDQPGVEARATAGTQAGRGGETAQSVRTGATLRNAEHSSRRRPGTWYVRLAIAAGESIESAAGERSSRHSRGWQDGRSWLALTKPPFHCPFLRPPSQQRPSIEKTPRLRCLFARAFQEASRPASREHWLFLWSSCGRCGRSAGRVRSQTRRAPCVPPKPSPPSLCPRPTCSLPASVPFTTVCPPTRPLDARSVRYPSCLPAGVALEVTARPERTD
ncbi:hypothetical protein VTN02DRAFT_5006 [Thermoascus thermophilus]